MFSHPDDSLEPRLDDATSFNIPRNNLRPSRPALRQASRNGALDAGSSFAGRGLSRQRAVSLRRRTKTSTMIETIRTTAVAIS